MLCACVQLWLVYVTLGFILMDKTDNTGANSWLCDEVLFLSILEGNVYACLYLQKFENINKTLCAKSNHNIPSTYPTIINREILV